jgi:hypothetical protein
MPKTKAEKRKAVLISLDPAVHAAAALTAEKHGTPFSRVVEEMLVLYIELMRRADNDQA